MWLALAIACTGADTHLKRPNRLALAPDGGVWVSDFLHDRIVRFDADGRFLRAFGGTGIGTGQLWRVTAMATTPDGQLVVANRRPLSDRSDSGSTLELKWFDEGREQRASELDGAIQVHGWIDDVAPGPRPGTWLIANATDGELLEVDDDGRWLGRFGGVPRVDAAPSMLLADLDGYWIVEQYRQRILHRRKDGTQTELTLDTRFPTAVGVCRDEWIAIADLGNHRVLRVDLSTGDLLAAFEPDRAGPDQPVQLLDLAVTPDCSRIYLVDSKGNRVLVTDPEGRVLQTLATW